MNITNAKADGLLAEIENWWMSVRQGSTSDTDRCDATHYRQFDAIIDPETSRSLSSAFTFASQPDLMDNMLSAGEGRDTDLLDIKPDAV